MTDDNTKDDTDVVDSTPSRKRSAISDELAVPDQPPDPETESHVLPDEKLQYPEFTFENGKMVDGKFALERSLNREDMRQWLEELSGGLASHDIGVSTADETAIFGVGAGDVSMAFDPDDDHRGTLEVTFSLNAKLMTFSDDPEERRAGARGGEGFIPIEMLTTEKKPQTFRCYNWIRDPVDRD